MKSLSGSSRRCFPLAVPLLVGMVLGGCRAAVPLAHTPIIPDSTAAAERPGPVLFVLSAAGEQILANGKRQPTGYFLGEFFEAYQAVRGAGFEAVFATPNGQIPRVDPESLKPSYWRAHPTWLDQAQAFVASDPNFKSPLRLSDALAQQERFSGLIVPGGQGLMVDLLANEDLKALLVRFGNNHRPVGLICHAPMLLTRLPEENPFKGRTLTSVSGFEEFFIETFIMGGQAQNRSIGSHLGALGYQHRAAFPGRPLAVRDCNLVTSQNPYSGDAFTDEYRKALAGWLQGERCTISASSPSSSATPVSVDGIPSR